MEEAVKAKLGRARSLRKSMSVAEQWLWSHIRNDQLGFRFRRQYVVPPYILDFYCPEAKLCIEVDGEQHVVSARQDGNRDEFLSKQGIMVLRIPSLDVFSSDDPMHLHRWLTSIEQHLVERTGREASTRILAPKRFRD